jgi:peptidoglycan/xylan/chitin deacetylase (PgdA/CDA1 family)
MSNPEPLVSFTFDDFPRSALLEGGTILREHGLKGTFFASFGLMGSVGPSGEIFTREDLDEFIRQGHEIGCHTYDHCHSWNTASDEFATSIRRNQRALEKYLPGHRFKTFSYPISCPRPETKRKTGEYFECCRCGGQEFNSGIADLSHLKGFFIEQSRGDLKAIEEMIENNARQKGWLIFATHDISESPTQFGCTPSVFERIVRCAIQSGAKTLPIKKALQLVRP